MYIDEAGWKLDYNIIIFSYTFYVVHCVTTYLIVQNGILHALVNPWLAASNIGHLSLS